MKNFLKILPLLLVTCVHADSLETIAQKRLKTFVQEAPKAPQKKVGTKVITKKVEKKFTQKVKDFFTLELPKASLSDYQQHQWTFSLLGKMELPTTEILDGNASSDLELLESKKSLLNTIDRTFTGFGQDYLSYLLTNPTSDVSILRGRQDIIFCLGENGKTHTQLRSLLATIAQSEKELLLLWEEEEQNPALIEQLKAPLYYTGEKTKKLNSSPLYQETAVTAQALLTAALITDIVNPSLRQKAQTWISMGITTFGVSKYYGITTTEAYDLVTNKYNDFKEFITPNFLKDDKVVAFFNDKRVIFTVKAYVAVVSTYAIAEKVADYNKICLQQQYLQAKMIPIANIVRAMKEINRIISENSGLSENLVHAQALSAFFTKNSDISPKMGLLVKLLETNTFTGKASYFSRQGRTKAAFALLEEIKDELAPALCAIGEIDAYVSATWLFIESAHGSNPRKYAFAQYVENAETPSIQLTDMWNPFVNKDVAVVNSITLGGDLPRNVIITGPNAGGKSTFLKGLTVSIILAQTLGIAPCEKLIFTPFEKISTYMNIVDDIAAGNSLFKAEVLRAQELINTIETQTETNGFCFSVLDEIFSGTAPKEGAAASWSIANHLGKCKNSIALIASHFVAEMTTLEKSTTTFKNYCVKVDYNEDGSFTYRFKLEPGITDQNVAIDILQRNGFDSDILQGARDKLAE